MDYIIVKKDNGEEEKMEVVSIYNMENSDYNYIIYRSLINDEYYTAKYKGNDVVDLDTDLSKEEEIYADSILRAIVGD